MIRILCGACVSLALVAASALAVEAQQLSAEGMVSGSKIEIRD
jgi:hypothetical protein